VILAIAASSTGPDVGGVAATCGTGNTDGVLIAPLAAQAQRAATVRQTVNNPKPELPAMTECCIASTEPLHDYTSETYLCRSLHFRSQKSERQKVLFPEQGSAFRLRGLRSIMPNRRKHEGGKALMFSLLREVNRGVQ
jgi:hypothetical protein